MIYKTNSPEETHKVALELSKNLKIGDVVCLDGDLGVGKTMFTKGLSEGLKVSDYVTSPTYTIINRYEAPVPVFHIDAYRIDDVDEMYEIGFEDCLNSGITVIEWSKIIEDILPQDRIRITIKKDMDIGENYREIEIIM